MSLTKHLNDGNSPIGRFMREKFPDIGKLLAGPRRRLRKRYTIWPEECENYPWSTIGVALDCRIRYYFAVSRPDDLIAYRGAQQLSVARSFSPPGRQLTAVRSGDSVHVVDERTGETAGIYWPDLDAAVTLGEGVMVPAVMEAGRSAAQNGTSDSISGDPPLAVVYQEFFSRLSSFTDRHCPVAKRLPRSEEDKLNRYCSAMARMEETYRAGKAHSVSADLGSNDVEELQGPASSVWIDDLRELSWEFYDRFNHLMKRPHVLNPTFDGSKDVGGADADLIIDNTLIEIKTTTKLEIPGRWILQLLGYVLLDYSDKFRIDSIGLYMARQGEMFTWSVDEVINCVASEKGQDINRLRKQFRDRL